MTDDQKQHGHYFKPTGAYEFIDVYRVLDLYEVTDPCLQHAVKKLLRAGQRGGKSQAQDVDEARHSLERWQEMRDEDALTRQPTAQDKTNG
jgi:hypothetical protein